MRGRCVWGEVGEDPLHRLTPMRYAYVPGLAAVGWGETAVAARGEMMWDGISGVRRRRECEMTGLGVNGSAAVACQSHRRKPCVILRVEAGEMGEMTAGTWGRWERRRRTGTGKGKGGGSERDEMAMLTGGV